MDDDIRTLERRVRQGETDALAPYAQACVRAQRNVYEFLPLFVENRRNAELRKVLNDTGLLRMRHYGSYDLLQADDYVLPTGNVLAFNDLMDETPRFEDEFILAEQNNITTTILTIKKGNMPQVSIDLSTNGRRFLPEDKNTVFSVLFGNLSSAFTEMEPNKPSYWSGDQHIVIRYNNGTISELQSISYQDLSRTHSRIQHSCIWGVPRHAVKLLSPPSQ